MSPSRRLIKRSQTLLYDFVDIIPTFETIFMPIPNLPALNSGGIEVSTSREFYLHAACILPTA